MNFEIYNNPRINQLDFETRYDPIKDLLDDKLFSPALVHMPPEFHYEANNESDGRYGLQYGTNEISISDFLNSDVNWDQISYDESCNQYQNFPLLNVKDNGSGSDTDVEVANMTVSNSSNNMHLFPNFTRSSNNLTEFCCVSFMMLVLLYVAVSARCLS